METAVAEQLDFRSAEFVAQLARLRAGSLPQEELDASPFRKLLHCVLEAEASAHAALERAASSGWEGWCYPKVHDDLERHCAVVMGAETEAQRAACRVHFKATATFPQFLVAEVQEGPRECRMSRLRAVRPEAVWTCGNWLVKPNPYIYDHEKFARDPLSAKDDARGFELAAWWIHPHFQRGSSLFGHTAAVQQTPMARQTSATGDMTAHSVRPADLPGYMFTAESFDASHLGELAELEAAIREHMSRVYGIDEVDDADVFFHDTHLKQAECPFFATAHLHIVHKRPRRIGCFQQAITLANVINHITATGQSFEEPLVLACFREFREGIGESSFGWALSAEQRRTALAGGHVLNNLDLIQISDDGKAVAAPPALSAGRPPGVGTRGRTPPY